MSGEEPYSVHSLFSAVVEDHGDRYVIELPQADFEAGTLDAGGTYRLALLATREQQPSGSRPPVEPGETRYVEIEDTGKQDDGIARVERGYVLIVPETAVGDRVKVEIAAVDENFAVAEVIDE